MAIFICVIAGLTGAEVSPDNSDLGYAYSILFSVLWGLKCFI